MSELADDGLPLLRDVVAKHSIAATKALGQNFLFDLNITRKIARSSGDLEGVTVIEIGPGPGGLTRALLSEGAAKVIVIERDERCLPALEEIKAHFEGRLEIISGDALSMDYAGLVPQGTPAKIIANLPYNIGTELLLTWLTLPQWPPFYQSLTLMFQREVAQRIIAEAGDDAFGRLSVICGWRMQSDIMFDLPASVFSPPPKVTSSVVHLVPRTEPLPVALNDLETVTRHAFGQRRKMLRQSLKPIGGEALLDKVGIDPTLRAERLEVAEFVALANAL